MLPQLLEDVQKSQVEKNFLRKDICKHMAIPSTPRAHTVTHNSTQLPHLKQS